MITEARRKERQVVRDRQNEAIRAVADAMTMHGRTKWGVISELLSAYGIGIGPEALKNYASKARQTK